MARILVAYATKHGSTAGVAEAVARELTAAGLDADVAVLEAVDSLEGYDGAVLGAPLYMGRAPSTSPYSSPATGTRSPARPSPRLESA